MSRDGMGDGVGRLHIHRHELDRPVYATGREQPACQRVVEGLVQLGVDQSGQQRGIRRANLQPQRALTHTLTDCAAQGIDGLGDALVIQRDALHGISPCLRPVLGLETGPGTSADLGEGKVIGLEAFGDATGDLFCAG
ncbi:hypothetical protein D3C71_1745910 [compost metagenome]